MHYTESQESYDYVIDHRHSGFVTQLIELPEKFQDELIEGCDISDKGNVLLIVYTEDYIGIDIIECRPSITKPVSTTQAQNIIPGQSLFYLGASHAKPETIESVTKYLQQKIRKGVISHDNARRIKQ